MTCQRCNISDRPTARCLVSKGEDVEVERLLCRDCREFTRQTYPVTVLDDPQDGEETRQDAPQTASADAPAPKGRTPRARHMLAMDGGPVCRQAKAENLTGQPGDVTCQRCLAKL